MQLYNGDCLEIMKDISNNSIDIVIADLPYGRFSEVSVGATKWDTAIDLKKMWKQLWRICKPNAPIFLFGDFKFSVELYNSQPEHFRYEIVWDKERTHTPLLSSKRFGKCTEYILVFYKNQPVYNYTKYHKKFVKEKKTNRKSKEKHITSQFHAWDCPRSKNIWKPKLPLNIIKCKNKSTNKIIKCLTEKPQFILEYLLKYFSNEGDVCLDITMGSGSMGVACNTLNRKFIGIEKNKTFFDLTKKRLNQSSSLELQ